MSAVICEDFGWLIKITDPFTGESAWVLDRLEEVPRKETIFKGTLTRENKILFKGKYMRFQEAIEIASETYPKTGSQKDLMYLFIWAYF